MVDLKRLRAHPDNKTKQAMQRDCEQAADELEALRSARLVAEAAHDLLAFAQWFLENRDGPGRSMAQAAVDKAVGAA